MSAAGVTAVTVVVPTCGDAVALERAIVSILATGYEPLEVVVVENVPPAPSTRSVVAERFCGAPVHYLEEPRIGASRARNAGLALADGDVVAFTDDDVVVDPGWLRNAVTAFEHPDAVACVTGRIQALALDTPSQLLFEQFAVFDKGPERRVWRLPESRAAEPLFPYVAGHVGSGANVLIRREVAQHLRGFDTQLGPGTPTLGGEDLDLFVRLVQAGYTIVYDPSVLVRHDHPKSLDGRFACRYGVGLTAMLGKQLVRGPARRQLIRAIPGGIRYGLNPTSRKNAQKPSDYPSSLDLLERFGMLLGPGAYLASIGLSAVRRR